MKAGHLASWLEAVDSEATVFVRVAGETKLWPVQAVRVKSELHLGDGRTEPVTVVEVIVGAKPGDWGDEGF